MKLLVVLALSFLVACGGKSSSNKPVVDMSVDAMTTQDISIVDGSVLDMSAMSDMGGVVVDMGAVDMGAIMDMSAMDMGAVVDMGAMDMGGNIVDGSVPDMSAMDMGAVVDMGASK